MKQVNNKGVSRLKRLFLGFWHFVNMAMLLLWSIAYLARWLPAGDFWWAQVLAATFDFISYALIGLVFFNVIFKRWRWFWLQLVALCLWGFRFYPFGWNGQQAQKDDWVILTYNNSFDPTFKKPVTTFQQFIQETNADVIALQESFAWKIERPPFVEVTPHAKTLLSELKYQSIASDTLNQLVEPAIFAKKTIQLEQVKVFQGILSGVRYPKNIFGVRVLLKWEGKKVVLYSFHLNSLGDQRPWDYRDRIWLPETWRIFRDQYRSAFWVHQEQVQKLVARMKQETLPIIVMGDFNSTMHHWEYQQFLNIGLKDVFLEAGKGKSETFPNHRPFFRIDHILVSEHWETVSANVLNAPFSDHLPVLARIRLK